VDPLSDPALRNLFEEEAAGLLDALEALLPRLADPETLDALCRHAHTLKGSAAVMNVAPVATAAAALEDVFEALRDRAPEPGSDILPVLGAAIADVRYVVTGLIGGIDVGRLAEDAAESLRALSVGLTPGDAPASSTVSAPACDACARLLPIVEALVAAQASTLRLLARHTGTDPESLPELRALTSLLPAAATAGAALLVVEDSPTIRELHRALLAEAGYEVRTARDGNEALRLLGERPAAAIVTDLEMPGMDGVRLTESIRRDPGLAGAGIVVVTSRDDEPTRVRTMIAGADAYLIKAGLEQSRLVGAVEKLLGAPA
jgi:CheY-like chemotaxis protein